MTIKLGVIMDPIASINPFKDSTLAILAAAQAREWALYYLEQQDLYQKNQQPMASMKALQVNPGNTSFFHLGAAQHKSLATLDVILMRKDPPVDQQYIYTTYLLEQAHKQHKVLVVNDAQSLRDYNEKLFATQFPCIPETLVSANIAQLKDFTQLLDDVIFKPLDGMGGTSIFRCKKNDPNLSVILETLTQFQEKKIMAQQYIPAIKQGDKRILMIEGEAIPYALARVPADNETRGNLAAGGKGVGVKLTSQDWEIIHQVGPVLRKKGLVFVGIDIIGNYLTEINITSPTCIRELNKAFNLEIEKNLLNAIEQKLLAKN